MRDLLLQAGYAIDGAEHIEAERSTPFGQRRNGEILANGKRREELIDLIALCQAKLADLGDAVTDDIMALKLDTALGRRDLARQHLEEGTLAGAVRSDDAPPLAASHGEIDALVGEKAAIPLGDTFGLQNDFAGLTLAVAADKRNDRRRGPRRHSRRIGLRNHPILAAPGQQPRKVGQRA